MEFVANGKPYTPFHLTKKVDIPESTENLPPAFLAGDCQPYDKHYAKITKPYIPKEGEILEETNIFTQETFPTVHNFSNDVDLSFPSPYQYKTQKEYQDACMNWYTESYKYFSSALLPNPLNGEFYLPEAAKIFSPQEKSDPARFRTFKAALWKLMPKNYHEMCQYIWENKKDIDPSAQFGEQYPKREVIYMKHHITSDEQWMAQLIPPEPVPEFYDTLEEYDEAYTRWATLTDNLLVNPPPTPEEYKQIIDLDVIVHADPELPKYVKLDGPIEVPCDPRLTSLKTPDESLIGKIFTETLNSAIDKEICIKGEEEDKDRYLFVSGVDHNNFVKNHIEMGIDPETLNSKEPCHPTSFFSMYPGDASEIQGSIHEGKITIFNMKKEFIDKLLEINVPLNDADAIMNIPLQGKKFGEHLGNFLSKSENLKYVIDISNKSQMTKIRTSIMLRAMLARVETSKILDLFNEQGTLYLLHQMVSLLTLSSEKVNSIISMIESKDPGLIAINKIYLFSCLTHIFANYSETPFFEFLRESCRKQLYSAAKYLNSPDLKDLIVAGLKGNEMNDGTRAAMMVAMSDSMSLHRLLVGSNYIEWVNGFSESRNGIVFLQTLSHSPALYPLALNFLKGAGKTITAFLDQMTMNTCIFVRYVIMYLLESSADMHVSFNGSTLLTIFEKIALCKRKEVSVMMVPTACVICSRELISNFNQSDFQTLITGSVGKMCRQIDSVTDFTTFRQQLLTLLMLAKDENCCMSMSLMPKFMNAVVDQLTCENVDVNVAFQVWKFFKMMMRNGSVLENIMKKEEIRTKLAAIPTSGKLIALRKFLSFTLYVFSKMKADTIKAWYEMMKPSVNDILKLHLRAKRALRDDFKLQKALQKFVRFCQTTKEPALKDLSSYIKKELKKLQEENKKRLKIFGLIR